MIKAAAKWRNIEAHIRHLVVSGQWQPHYKLPTYETLEGQFGVSRITIRQVISHLKKEGFINSIERQGIFVSDKPPHRFRYGIVIPRHESEIRFWQEIVATAQTLAARAGCSVVVYRNTANDEESRRTLFHDAAHDRLAGLILLFGKDDWPFVRPLLTADSIPKAMFLAGSPPHPTPPMTMVLGLDEAGMIGRALTRLREQGRRRIAHFANLNLDVIPPAFQAEVERQALEAPEAWRFRVPGENFELAGQIACLLLQLPPDKRPEGFFISDDNLMPHVLNGIAAAGCRCPEDIAVVSHYNWSVGKDEVPPVACVGFDLADMMQRVFDGFRLWHETGRLPTLSRQEPVFGEERRRRGDAADS